MALNAVIKKKKNILKVTTFEKILLSFQEPGNTSGAVTEATHSLTSASAGLKVLHSQDKSAKINKSLCPIASLADATTLIKEAREISVGG